MIHTPRHRSRWLTFQQAYDRYTRGRRMHPLVATILAHEDATTNPANLQQAVLRLDAVDRCNDGGAA